MKPRFSKKRNAAMTLFEVGVVIVIVMILVAMLVAALHPATRRVSRIYCVNNLKQLGLSYRIWAGDNGNTYPMGISVTNGGTMELVQAGNAVATYQVMSNELSTPKILLCTGDRNSQGDTSRTFATNFSSLANSNISYFVGVDTTNGVNPQLILSGDSNFENSGKPVKSGLLSVWTNNPMAWTAARHKGIGYFGFTDGSVQLVTTPSLQSYFNQTGIPTNRLAIP